MILSQLYNVNLRRAAVFCIFASLLAACNLPGRIPTPGGATPDVSQPGQTAAPVGDGTAQPASPEAATPTAEEPWAARVNGLAVPQSAYQAGLAQMQQARGAELAPEDKQRVLDDLIDQALLAQAAQKEGFTLNEEALQQRIAALQQQMGGAQALEAWMQAQGYTPESFGRALALSAAAAWMRDRIAAQTPTSAEQVHARQILLYNEAAANEVFGLLKNGNSFDNLAIKYDPVTGGDLGWFPRGYLLDAGLEEAVFALQPGATTDVIKTVAGYHIVQLIERDPQRPLLPDALLKLQQQALAQWLAQARSAAQIEVNP